MFSHGKHNHSIIVCCNIEVDRNNSKYFNILKCVKDIEFPNLKSLYINNNEI